MNNSCKRWTVREEHILSNDFLYKSDEELIIALPGRTIGSIIYHAKLMGLKRPYSSSRKGLNDIRRRGHGKISGSYISRLRCGAQARNLSYSLLDGSDESYRYLNDIITDLCPFSGRPLTFRAHSTDFSSTASLDRIDSNLGYERGNVRWIHKTVNRMKSNGSDKWFMSLIKDVFLHTQL